MLIDTHCHLADPPLFEDLPGVLGRARTAGVERIVVPSSSPDDWERVASLAREPGVAAAFGVHPWKAVSGVDLPSLRVRLTGAVAVGEVGLDWRVDVPRNLQMDCLEAQLILARELELPVLLHCRGAFDELLELLRAHPPRGSVIHGFSRGTGLMRRFLEHGCHIGFGGAVTRAGARSARASAVEVPDDRFVLETDSPWIGVEGGPSEPSSLRLVARAMAYLRGVAPERVECASYGSAAELGLC
jgi:TatD DNase family protein